MTPAPRPPTASALLALLAGLLAGAGTPAAAQSVTIGSGPPANPPGYAAPVGNTVGVLDVVGQSFVAPSAAASRLDDVQFWLRNAPTVPGFPDFRNLSYRLYVAPFDAGTRRLAAAPVFQSPARSGTADVAFTGSGFSTGGVTLLPGQLYLAFLVPDEPALPYLTPLVGEAAGFTGDPYAGGQAYTLRYAAGSPAPGTGPFAGAWTAPAPGADFAFTATFAAVPEPAPWALVGAGAGTLGAAARARRRRPTRSPNAVA